MSYNRNLGTFTARSVLRPSLPDSIPKRQALILELVSVADVVVLFGGEDDAVTRYMFRLAKLAKRTVYCIGFVKIPES